MRLLVCSPISHCGQFDARGGRLIRILHGDDEFSISEAMRRIREAAGSDDVRDSNTTTFEGGKFTLAEVVGAASVMPFLAERRVIFVHGLLGRLDSRDSATGGDWNSLGEALAVLPASSDVVFVESKSLRRNGRGIKVAGPRAEAQEFTAPRGPALEGWIRDRIAHHGASGDRDAVARLAWLVGGNLRLLDSEIQKLALYSAGREINRGDVDEMVSDAREVSIFAAVDAILERRPGVAMRLLYSMLGSGASSSSIISMLARQVRLNLLAGELGAANVAQDEIGRRIGLTNRFALEKTLRQSGRFNREYLANVHRRLLGADLAIKTGKLEERLAVEILVGRVSAA